ncbi:MAG: hypothetical protein KDD00_01870 [Ignavibacteriae bacterium]|nr:hypothetical protein [Ignavibacteriota bacterium]
MNTNHNPQKQTKEHPIPKGIGSHGDFMLPTFNPYGIVLTFYQGVSAESFRSKI